jgi:hypothetical protein
LDRARVRAVVVAGAGRIAGLTRGSSPVYGEEERGSAGGRREWSIAALRSLAETHVSCRDRIAADPDVLEAASAALLRGGSPLNARAAGVLGRVGGRSTAAGGVAAALSLGGPFLGPRHAVTEGRRARDRITWVRAGVSTVSVDALMGMMTNAAADRLTDETPRRRRRLGG